MCLPSIKLVLVILYSFLVLVVGWIFVDHIWPVVATWIKVRVLALECWVCGMLAIIWSLSCHLLCRNLKGFQEASQVCAVYSKCTELCDHLLFVNCFICGHVASLYVALSKSLLVPIT